MLVKAYDTESIHPVHAILQEDGIVLSLQNGLGNPERLVPMFGEDRVAAGVATYGAYRVSPGVIGWGGDGSLVLGPWNKGLDMSWAGELLQHGGLSVTYVEDPRPAIWRKLAINAQKYPADIVRGKSKKYTEYWAFNEHAWQGRIDNERDAVQEAQSKGKNRPLLERVVGPGGGCPRHTVLDYRLCGAGRDRATRYGIC